jgi:uncharacterized protein YggE
MRLVIGAALAAAVLGVSAAAAQSVPIALAPDEVLLNVEAEGVSRTRPDVMEITAAVVTTGRSAREALAANSALASRLIEAVRGHGVEARDVQTAELAVDPQFDRSDGEREDRRPRITGYIVRNRLQLRLRDLTKAPQIVDSLFTAGANEVRGPIFSLSDPRPAQSRARRAAVEAAREEASAYAEALNMRITRVLRVSERGNFDVEHGDRIVVTGARIAATPIEPGEIRTNVRIWVDFAMTPK